MKQRIPTKSSPATDFTSNSFMDINERPVDDMYVIIYDDNNNILIKILSH